MNANELADKLLEDLREADLFNLDSVNYGNRKHYIDQLESVVRQQQAEIEALKKELNARFEAGKALGYAEGLASMSGMTIKGAGI